MRPGAGVGFFLFFFFVTAAGAAAGCSTADATGPACTNESSVAPYGEAGVLPLRALPTGFPCAAGAVCYATIDNCSDDWPDGAIGPASANATPFTCECPDGVWSCASESATPPVCNAAPPAGVDAGLDAGVG